MKRIVYLSVPISNNPNWRIDCIELEKKVRKAFPNCEVINPINFEYELLTNGRLNSEMLYTDLLAHSITKLSRCNTFVSADYKKYTSDGCAFEKHFAAIMLKQIKDFMIYSETQIDEIIAMEAKRKQDNKYNQLYSQFCELRKEVNELIMKLEN